MQRSRRRRGQLQCWQSWPCCLAATSLPERILISCNESAFNCLHLRHVLPSWCPAGCGRGRWRPRGLHGKCASVYGPQQPWPTCHAAEAPQVSANCRQSLQAAEGGGGCWGVSVAGIETWPIWTPNSLVPVAPRGRINHWQIAGWLP